MRQFRLIRSAGKVKPRPSRDGVLSGENGEGCPSRTLSEPKQDLSYSSPPAHSLQISSELQTLRLELSTLQWVWHDTHRVEIMLQILKVNLLWLHEIRYNKHTRTYRHILKVIL